MVKLLAVKKRGQPAKWEQKIELCILCKYYIFMNSHEIFHLYFQGKKQK